MMDPGPETSQARHDFVFILQQSKLLATFTTPEFSLDGDLDALSRVLDVGANEAALLYCGRIVEALAGVMLARVLTSTAVVEASPSDVVAVQTTLERRSPDLSCPPIAVPEPAAALR